MPAYDGISDLQQAIGHGGTQVFDIAPTILRNIIRKRTWASRLDQSKRPFTSFEAFVAAPLWEGLQSNIDELLLYCRKRTDVEELIRGEVGPAVVQPHDEKGRFVRSDNVTTVRGNNPTYALRRLKRDRPDLADKVISGEMSANAAAIEAGFRKKPTPFEAISKLLPRLTENELNVLLAILRHLLSERRDASASQKVA